MAGTVGRVVTAGAGTRATGAATVGAAGMAARAATATAAGAATAGTAARAATAVTTTTSRGDRAPRDPRKAAIAGSAKPRSLGEAGGLAGPPPCPLLLPICLVAAETSRDARLAAAPLT